MELKGNQERRLCKISECYSIDDRAEKTIEEIKELIEELEHYLRWYREVKSNVAIMPPYIQDLAQEIADVTIMLYHIEHKFDIKKEIEDAIEFKISRQEDRLGICESQEDEEIYSNWDIGRKESER